MKCKLCAKTLDFKEGISHFHKDDSGRWTHMECYKQRQKRLAEIRKQFAKEENAKKNQQLLEKWLREFG